MKDIIKVIEEKNVNEISIDLAKNVFQIYGVNQAKKKQLSRKVSRSEFLELIPNLKEKRIYMEACAGANHFGRLLEKAGNTVCLIAPQYVSPYVIRNKNDQADAKAIYKASQDEDIHFVAVKKPEQQIVQMLHKLRKKEMEIRNKRVLEMRSYLQEFGLVFPKGREHFENEIASRLLDWNKGDMDGVPALVWKQVKRLFKKVKEHNQEIKSYEKEIGNHSKKDKRVFLAQTISGIGLLTSSLLCACVSDFRAFRNGRHFSAYLGLVPKHVGTGGKNRMLGISKRGNKEIRQLLVHGARSVLVGALSTLKAKGGDINRLSAVQRWVLQIRQSRGWNKACVAMANKLARIVYRVIRDEVVYDPKKAALAF